MDYYGSLGKTKRARPETLLHDYVQCLSGQGIPPTDAQRWSILYKRSKCQLVHVLEDKRTTRFIHIVKL
jgi:hypothetical protein